MKTKTKGRAYDFDRPYAKNTFKCLLAINVGIDEINVSRRSAKSNL